MMTGEFDLHDTTCTTVSFNHNPSKHSTLINSSVAKVADSLLRAETYVGHW